MRGRFWFILLVGMMLLAGCGGETPVPPPVGDVDRIAEEAARAYAARDWARAAELYEALTRARPHDADAWVRLGWALKATRRYEEALAAFARADREDPHLFWSALGQAQVYVQLERWDLAFAEYQRAIDIDPRKKSPHYQRVLLYLRLHQDDAAADAALFGLHYFPEDETLRALWARARGRH